MRQLDFSGVVMSQKEQVRLLLSFCNYSGLAVDSE